MAIWHLRLSLVILLIGYSTSTTDAPQGLAISRPSLTTHSPRTTLSNKTTDYMIKNDDKFCLSTPKPRSAVHMTFQIFVAILALAGNICVTIGICFSRVLRSRPTNYFVVSLAISDIAICLIVMPIQILGTYRNQSFCYSHGVCIFHVITDVVVHVASVTNLVFIAIDRFIAIVYPYKYSQFITKKTALLLISTAWGYSLLWGCLSIIKWDNTDMFSIEIYHIPQPSCINYNPYYYTMIYSVVYLIPLVLIGFMYAKVLRIALKQAKDIASLEISSNKNKSKNRRQQRSELKATKTVMIVYGTFLICWLPISIISISSNWCTLCWRNFRTNYETLFYFTYLVFAEILPPLNSSLNPFIYVLFGQQFRAAFKIVFLRMIGRRQPLDDVFDVTNGGTKQRGLTLQRMFRKKSSTVGTISQ